MTTLPPLKLVVFDMAGTTVHDEDFVNLAFQQAMKNGADLTVTRAEINDVMGMRKPDAIRTVLQLRRGPGAEVSVAEVNSLHDLFLAEMLSFYRHDPRVREIHGVSELFAALRAKGIRVALDSGFSRDIMDVIIDRLGWRDAIDDTCASDEVELGRPAPFMIRELMKRAGVSDPLQVLKAGDTPVDLQEGANAGCGFNIGVLSGASTRQELEGEPHTHILGSVVELPSILF